MALTKSRCHRRHAFAFVAILELQWDGEKGVGPEERLNKKTPVVKSRDTPRKRGAVATGNRGEEIETVSSEQHSNAEVDGGMRCKQARSCLDAKTRMRLQQKSLPRSEAKLPLVNQFPTHSTQRVPSCDSDQGT